MSPGPPRAAKGRAVLGIDLVEWMIRQAAGEEVIGPVPPTPTGAAIEVRLSAENPGQGFRPSAGVLTEVRFPAGIRVDAWIETGTEVTAFYDPMLAKVVVHAADRPAATAALRTALAGTAVSGIATNLDYLRSIAASDMLAEARVATQALAAFSPPAATVDVLAPGAQSSLQELPGRLGYWHVGVPPSGPMDAPAFRRANRLVDNADGTAALELTVAGPTLRFNRDARVALAGARATCSPWGRRRRFRGRGRSPRPPSRTIGPSASSTAPTAPRISSPTPTSRISSPLPTRSTSTAPGRGCA